MNHSSTVSDRKVEDGFLWKVNCSLYLSDYEYCKVGKRELGDNKLEILRQKWGLLSYRRGVEEVCRKWQMPPSCLKLLIGLYSIN